MKFKDYYQILGVDKRADAQEIKKAYRRLARRHHPDVNPGNAEAEATFKNLNEAHEVLGDPKKRPKYDRLGANWRQYENTSGPAADPFGGGGRWSVNVDGGHRSGRPISSDDLHGVFENEGFSDFFRTFFEGQTAAAAPDRGQDLEYTLELSLEDAFQGVTRRITLPDDTSRTVEVKIPAGVKTGSRVRVTGEGVRGDHGSSSGDLYLRIRLQRHPIFNIKDRNLYVTVEVPVTTAALGGEVDVPTPDASSLRLKIPGGTQPAQMFRLRGKGMPGLRPHIARGDLYATARVTIPHPLSAEARALYEALATLSG
jgi:DnaJ-class molecular chaperone